MKNLEEVVQERNKAYWLLETGETGERPGARVKDELGESCSVVTHLQICLTCFGVLSALQDCVSE